MLGIKAGIAAADSVGVSFGEGLSLPVIALLLAAGAFLWLLSKLNTRSGQPRLAIRLGKPSFVVQVKREDAAGGSPPQTIDLSEGVEMRDGHLLLTDEARARVAQAGLDPEFLAKRLEAAREKRGGFLVQSTLDGRTIDLSDCVQTAEGRVGLTSEGWARLEEAGIDPNEVLSAMAAWQSFPGISQGSEKGQKRDDSYRTIWEEEAGQPSIWDDGSKGR